VLPKRQVLADDVYDAIKLSVLTSAMPPGAKINLDQLARDIGVSNTPIRQALARLEAEGLVVKTPYKGYTVTNLLDLAHVEQLYEFRLLLEPSVAALAAERFDEADASAIDGIMAAARRAPARSDELDVQFHQAVASATHNSHVADQALRLQERWSAYRFLYRIKGAAKKAWEEHAAIADALLARDAEAARAAMRTHLQSALERVQRSLPPTGQSNDSR
jgi:DNA-binding GntR family transcriptional regulator